MVNFPDSSSHRMLSSKGSTVAIPSALRKAYRSAAYKWTMLPHTSEIAQPLLENQTFGQQGIETPDTRCRLPQTTYQYVQETFQHTKGKKVQ